MRALVPGDGEGRNGAWLAEQGLKVDTFDLSAFGVAKAKALASDRGVSVNAVQADALAWDWPEARYDLIALIYLHLVEPDAADRPREGAEGVEARRPYRAGSLPPGADSPATRPARAAAPAIRRCFIPSRRCGRISRPRRLCSSRPPRRGWTKAICTQARARSCGPSCGKAEGKRFLDLCVLAGEKRRRPR